MNDLPELNVLTSLYPYLNCRPILNEFCLNDMNELYTLIYDCLTGSCCAFVINGNIIYNVYNVNENKEFQENIRKELIKKPYSIINPGRKTNIDFYMFFNNSWRVNIRYDNGYYKIRRYN